MKPRQSISDKDGNERMGLVVPLLTNSETCFISVCASYLHVESMVVYRVGLHQKLLSSMNYLVYQLFTSLSVLQGNQLESEPGSPGNLGSQTCYCLISSTVFSRSNLNGVFLPGSIACKPSSCAYK